MIANAKPIAIAAVYLSCITFPMVAQQAEGRLPPDDSNLYQMFFTFHDDMNTFVQNSKAEDPVRGAKLEAAVARRLNIRQDELSRVAAVTHAAVLSLTQWRSDLKSYAAQARAKNQKQDQVTFQQFEQRRQQLISDAVRQLSSTVSTASWSGLRSFINSEYRLHIAVKRPGTH